MDDPNCSEDGQGLLPPPPRFPFPPADIFICRLSVICWRGEGENVDA